MSVPFQEVEENQGLQGCSAGRLDRGRVSRAGLEGPPQHPPLPSPWVSGGHSLSFPQCLQYGDVSRMIPCSLSPGWLKKKKNRRILIRDNKILFMYFEMEKIKGKGDITPLQELGAQIVA